MLENCVAVLRKNGSPALADELRKSTSNSVGFSALELILRTELNPGLYAYYEHLILEAPHRSDLSWDELEIIRAVLKINERLKITIFIDPKAHSWTLDPSIPPEGSEQLVKKLIRSAFKPRLVMGELETFTPRELHEAWQFLQNDEAIYRRTLFTDSPVVPTETIRVFSSSWLRTLMKAFT